MKMIIIGIFGILMLWIWDLLMIRKIIKDYSNVEKFDGLRLNVKNYSKDVINFNSKELSKQKVENYLHEWGREKGLKIKK